MINARKTLGDILSGMPKVEEENAQSTQQPKKQGRLRDIVKKHIMGTKMTSNILSIVEFLKPKK